MDTHPLRRLITLVETAMTAEPLPDPVEPPLAEKAPPGMEQWIEHRTPDFRDRYGDAWERVLYATAWKRHRARKHRKSRKKNK
jgi:hypothetical protein